MSTSHKRPFAHVPALDGVRALSLIAIMLCHNGFGFAKGGFAAVTVFFTLSGFLITSLLLGERERSGRISLKAFYVRRARRLAPAILVLFALIAVMLGTGALATSDTLLGDAAATAGWVANWRFLVSGQTYDALFAAPSPFQHMWSLAVEEQFYLLFPGLLVLALGRTEKLKRWRAILFVGGGIALSTYACWHLFTPGDAERAYYGTDCRMAEPFMGAFLALLLTRGAGVRRMHRAIAVPLDLAAVGALGGLALIISRTGQYSHFIYHGGLFLSALLTAVVIAGITQPRSIVGWALSLPPLAFLGRISYGTYVFHWPVFLWLTADRVGLDGWGLFGVRSAVTVLMAVASYELLERPVREARGFRVSLALPAWANATVMAMAVLALLAGGLSTPDAKAHGTRAAAAHSPTKTRTTAGRGTHAVTPGTSPVGRRPTKGRTPGLVESVPNAPATPGTTPVTTTPGTTPPRTTPRSHPTPTATPSHAPPLRIALVGDSMAQGLGVGMIDWSASQDNVQVKNFGLSGCPLSRGGMTRFPDGYERAYKAECNWWGDSSSSKRQAFDTFDPQVVVIQDGMNELLERKDVDGWNTYRKIGDPTYDAWLTREYQDLFAALNPQGTRTFELLNAVCADWSSVNHFNGFQLELDNRMRSLNTFYDGLSATGLVKKDYLSHLCPGTRHQYTSTVDGVQDGRYDGYHLTEEAATAVSDVWLGPICLDAVNRS